MKKILYKLNKNRINKKKKSETIETLQKAMEQWKWLQEHPDKRKEDYFKENEIIFVPYNYCYICDLHIRKKRWYEDDYFIDDPVCDCRQCPLMWTLDGKGTCTDEGSPYREWFEAINDEERIAAAKKVYGLIEATYCSIDK